MAMKTFQAETMIEALQMVQQELGPDAIVLSVRDAQHRAAFWRRPGVELVAMSQSDIASAVGQAGAPSKKNPVLRPSASGQGVEFIEERPEIEWAEPPAPAKGGGNGKTPRHWQIPRLSRADLEQELLARQQPKQPANNGHIPVETATFEPSTPHPAGEIPPALQRLVRQLQAQGVDDGLLQRLAHFARESLSPEWLASEDRCRAFLSQQLEADLVVQKNPPTGVAHRVIALVGPSGSGKTSALAKLALFFRQTLEKRVAWINADTVRTGAIAETRAYTDAIGLRPHLVYSPEELKAAVAGEADADLILIDTPGYNPCSEAQLKELGTYLTAVPSRCTYLVAAATTKESDLFQAFASLSLFGLQGLIFTKLDETFSFGNVYNFARKTQLPMAYFTFGKTTGQGNLRGADAGQLVRALFGNGWKR